MFNKCVPKIVQFKRYVEKYSRAGKTTYENLTGRMRLARWKPTGTRIVQADSGSDSDSESRRRSPRRLPASWYRRVQADYRR